MFAPYCPTCRRRMLLGAGRIVTADLGQRPLRVALRCFCGTVVPADNPVPLRLQPGAAA